MDITSKLARVKKLITDSGQNWDDFQQKLAEIGGTTDELRSHCTWENLEGCGLPKLIAKAVAKIFREKERSDKPAKPLSKNKAENATPEQLVAAYDPENSDNPVGKRLQQISNGQPFLIFNPDKATINTQASAQLLRELKDGLPPRDSFTVDGRPQIIYSVGEKPNHFAEINPLYPNEILRSGECAKTGLNWGMVSQEAKILVYLAVAETDNINSPDVDQAYRIFEVASQEDGANNLRVRYQSASVLYDELEGKGELPSLKKTLPTASVAASRRNDPFKTGVGYKNRTY